MNKPKDIIFDIEVYSNIFTAVLYSGEKDAFVTFEVSERKNDFKRFCGTVLLLGAKGARMVGFNNFAYDYPVIHALLILYKSKPDADANTVTTIAKRKSNQIINAPHDERFANIIWDNDQLCQQVDLFKIHHFDNVARATSLKVLEFNMRSTDIQELPFDPDKPVAVEDIPRLLEYNTHDVKETFKFYQETLDQIALREQLTKMYGKNFINSSDANLGKTIFQLQLEKALGSEICFTRKNGKRKPRQTFRKEIKVKEILFWYINFSRPEFNAVFDWLWKQSFAGTEIKSGFTGLIPEELGELGNYCDLSTQQKKEWGQFEINDKGKKVSKALVKNLNCVVDGFHFVFGTGGLHGCIEPCIVESDDTHVIVDLDVVSYYPSLAIVNEVFPKHLGKEFCTIYSNLKKQRVKHTKGTPENSALKLALNGVYGDSNNQYSPFYDPQYTVTITINGQLLLCVLSEWLMGIPGLKMIQANTDGVTVKLPRDQMEALDKVWHMWEGYTGLELESAIYSRMFIRDVNNYIAEYEDGNLKRKGAYEYKIGWHQNHSALVIKKAVEAHLVRGEDVRKFIEHHATVDPFDFYLRTKVPRTSHLLWRHTDESDGEVFEQRLQNISRYYISTTGGELVKVMPPLKKNPKKWREIGINKGWKVTVHDTVQEMINIDFDYYEQEAMKLIEPLTK